MFNMLIKENDLQVYYQVKDQTLNYKFNLFIKYQNFN